MAKKVNKSLTLPKKELEKVTNAEDTGIESTGGMTFPPQVKIFQSDRQYKFFREGQANVSDYGKLFIKPREAMLDRGDLVTSLKGTLLRVDFGFNVFDKDESKPNRRGSIVGSGRGMIRNEDKEEWLAKNPEHVFRNSVRILITQRSPEEIIAIMAEGENPYLMIELVGSTYSSWFTARDKMLNAVTSDKQSEYKDRKSTRGIIAPAFELTVKSVKESNKEGMEYFVYDFGFKMNEIEVAHSFINIHNELKDRRLFGEWGEDEKFEEVEEAETVDVDDLPFE